MSISSAAAARHLLLLLPRSSSSLEQKRRPPSFATPSLPQLPRASLALPCNKTRIARNEPAAWFSHTPETLFPVLRERKGKRRCLRVVAQPGRPKPKFSQPIRPRRRRRERPPSGNQPDPAGNIRRKVRSEPKEQEPYVRHPDDYYKFGPFGPYAYKADVAGPMLPATSLADDYYFMWSSVRDLQHQEQLDIQNACIKYHNRVLQFDESVGLQFFYVFSRLHFHAGPEAPWKQWTLVAEITVESGEDQDKNTLLDRLDSSIKNKITKYTAWFRPDLIYVKPKFAGFQVRFEPEMDFLRELRSMLMNSVGEPDEAGSYYGLFCQILGVDLNADSEEIIAKYEESSEKIQLACLEHLLSNHPVELLHHIPYPNRNQWVHEQTMEKSAERNTSETSYEKDVVDNAEGFGVVEDGEYTDNDEDDFEDEYQEEDEDVDENWDASNYSQQVNKDFVDPFKNEPESRNPDDFSNDGIDSDTEENGGKGTVRLSYMVKAAARPFTFVNFIREMIVLRGSLLKRKQQGVKNLLPSE